MRIRSFARSQLKMARRIAAAVRPPKAPIEVELHRPWFRDYDVATIIDVGANEGQFAGWARSAFPSAALYCFEPLPDCFGRLCRRFAVDPKFHPFDCALGAAAGEAEIFQNVYSPASSMRVMRDTHRQAFPYAASSTPVRVAVRTLDEVLRDVALAPLTLLKIDVQGAELDVLAGGARTLTRTRLVLIETSLEQLYEDEPLFDAVYRVMRDRGFVLRAAVDMLRRPADGRPLQIDVLFENEALSGSEASRAS
jgi:FkbM family methyltransferase